MMRLFRSVRRLGLLLAVAVMALPVLVLTGCGVAPEERLQQGGAATVSAFVPDRLVYARRFRLLRHGDRTVLEVMASQGAQPDTLRYLLLADGADFPSGFEQFAVIRTPVKRLAVFSTTQIGFVDLLGEVDRIIGVSRADMVNTPALRRRIARGLVADIGMPFSPNLESIVSLEPELVLAPALPPSTKTSYQLLEQSAIPVLVVAEWLESSPLGRAEWIKLFGALLGRDELARECFADIEASYLKIASLSRRVSQRPTVLTGLPFKDSWFMPAGDSYVAALLHDAGSFYHWRDLPGTGSVPLGIESVYPVALEADYWLNPGTVSSLEELASIDARFAQLRSVRQSQVYNNNRQVNAAGGNAYWEFGVVRPDLILKDLVMIFHPGLLGANGIREGEFTFYREVNAGE